MKVFLKLIILTLIINLSGCCCPINPFGKQNADNSISNDSNADNSESSRLKNISPLEYIAKTKQMVTSINKINEQLADPNISNERRMELEEELSNLQEEMDEYRKAYQNSSYFKGLENSSNPMVRNAIKKAKESQEEYDKVNKERERLLQEIQQESYQTPNNMYNTEVNNFNTDDNAEFYEDTNTSEESNSENN